MTDRARPTAPGAGNPFRWRPVRFRGRELHVIGREHDAALALNDRIAEGIGVSSPHLETDGLVRRHGEVIDTKADIEPLEDWRCAPATR